MVWTNWAREQRCAPVRVERPGSEEELGEVVARAAREGLTMKAVGAGHSFTDCACTDGVMVDLSQMQRVLSVAGEHVTVEAGIRLRRLGEELATRGLGLQNQGDIDAQALAGAVATATHGTGVRFGNLSSRITRVRLVTASGEVREITGGDELLAARVSLGALGVVSALTVHAVPLFTLHRHDEPRPLRGVLDELDALVDGTDHFEFFVFPYTRTALTRTSRRSQDPPEPEPAWKRRMQEDVVENGVLGAVCRTGRLVPRAVPALNRALVLAMTGGHVTDHAYRVYASRRSVRFTEMEYAIPRAHAREAVERVVHAFESRRLPIGFPIEVRFAAGDDAFLSTAHGRETAYVAVHQYRGMEFETAFRAVEAVMDGCGGRPHWGKRHYQSAATLRERYPQWARFQAVRDALDPERVFANDHTRRVLG